jgi:mannose-6-phosphate isomerase-like protein (cupin superfamily)
MQTVVLISGKGTRPRPMGEFEQYTLNRESTVKIINVAPDGMLSSQYRFERDELWVVLDDRVCVELEGEVLHPQPQEKIFIPRRTTHRLCAVGNKSVRVLERRPRAHRIRVAGRESTQSVPFLRRTQGLPQELPEVAFITKTCRWLEVEISALQRRSKALSRARSYTRLPAFSSSIADTACRFNRYDKRCKLEYRRRKEPVLQPAIGGL